jgi:hypothetical protein
MSNIAGISKHNTSIRITDTEISLLTNNISAFNIDNNQQIGINLPSSTPSQLNINSTTGDCLNLIYNNTQNSTFSISSIGNFYISTSGSKVLFTNNVDIINHGGGSGLYLSGALITSSADQLNYNNNNPGVATANRSLILDSSKNIATINSLTATSLVATSISGTLTTASQPNITSLGTLTGLNVSGTTILSPPLAPTSGGTGINTYTKGDMIISSGTNILSKLAVPSNNGYFLTTNSSTSTGLEWSLNYLSKYFNILSGVLYTSPTIFSFDYFYGRNTTDISNIIINTTTTINLNNTGINGINVSGSLTGTLNPNPVSTTITGTGTVFTTDIIEKNIVISVNGQSRKVISITSNTSIVIDSIFTVLNRWTLGATGTLTGTVGLIKYGTGAFNGSGASTSNATLTMGDIYINFISTTTAWTLELYIRITSLTGGVMIFYSALANSLRLTSTNAGVLTLSLGQGTTFNIANAVATTGTVVINTYYHFALVCTGTTYNAYLNGNSIFALTNSNKITTGSFNSFLIGGGASNFTGQLDEIRISNIARYATTFTAPSSEFTIDSNTISLNHFNDTSNITLSDITTLAQYPYIISGSLYANTVYYMYAITDGTNIKYIVSSNYNRPYLPSGYTLYTPIPFAISTNGSAVPYYSFNSSSNSSGNYINIASHIPLVTGAGNVSPTILNTPLDNYIPRLSTKIQLLITHTHVGNTSTSIVVGNSTNSILYTLLTTAIAGPSFIIIDIPLTKYSLDSYLSLAATTTTYSLAITGYFL